jgi:TRAP-type mannitol/chloroaromatic compound transport system substrate-binding protein
VALDILQGTAQRIADRVAAMTGGRFQIEVFEAGKIVPGLEVLDAVQSGTVECGHTATYYFVGKNEAFGIATALPFGLTPQQQNAWLYHGGGMEAIQKLYADFNAISFPAGNTGTQMGGWFNREVETVDDLAGLRFRIPGIGGRVMERLDVDTQTLPADEIFLALDRKAIDAAEWIGPYDDKKLGLHEAASYYYHPGWWEPGPTLDVIVNLDAWNALTPEYQAIFEAAAAEANIWMLSQYEASNQQALEEIIQSGVEFRAYSEDILTAARDTAFELYEELASDEPAFREVFEPWRAFRERIYRWTATNELTFSTFAMQEKTGG